MGLSFKRTKIDRIRWGDNHANGIAHIALNQSYDFDRVVDDINQLIENLPGNFVVPIDYESQTPKLHEAFEQMGLLNAYAWKSASDIDFHIDQPFHDDLDGPTGVLEGLERIRADSYQIENNLGLTKTTKIKFERGVGEFTTVPKTIGLNDIMNNDILGGGSAGVPSFTDIFQLQFDQLQTLDETIAGLDFDDYITHLVERGNISHTPDHWLNGLSTVLDTVGVVSGVAVFTGRNFLTKEILTDEERSAAGFNAALNVGILGISVLSGGLGAKAKGGRAVVKAGGRALVRDVVSSMAGGTAGLVTAGVLDTFGAPTWLKIPAAAGVSYFTGARTSRALDNQFSNVDWRRNVENGRNANSITTNPDHWNLNRSVIGGEGTIATPEQLIEGVRPRPASLFGEMNLEDSVRYKQHWASIENGTHLPPDVTANDLARMNLANQRLRDVQALNQINGDELLALRRRASEATRVINRDGSIEIIGNGVITRTIDNRPYLNPASRPSFRKGVPEATFEAARGPDGLVRDPLYRDIIIEWKLGQPRKGIWDMGHLPQHKYSEMHARYLRGELTPSEFRDWFNNPAHYRPELPRTNRSHVLEYINIE